MYFSIHNHSHFSISDALSTPLELFEEATKKELKGIVLTEHGNLLSAPYVNKIKGDFLNLKVGFGIEFYEIDSNGKYFHLIVIAKNIKGYKKLCKVASQSYKKKNFYYNPRMSIRAFKDNGEDFIVTSACLAGRLARESDREKRIEIIRIYKGVFPNFYLEMQSHKDADQEKYNKELLELAEITNTKFVITTDTHYKRKEDKKAHSYFININRHNTDIDGVAEIYDGCYIQSSDEIHEVMDKQIGKDNVEIGLNETLDIMEMIEDYDIFQEPVLPVLYENEEEILIKKIKDGAKRRGIDLKTNKVYGDRTKMEFNTIKKMGFIGYFLLVEEMIGWAKENGILVSAGRGSSSSSIINYFLNITNADPIKYKLIFSRFLNENRTGLPDIDVDLSDKNKVVDHLIDKYGVDRVSQTLALSTFTPKVAIRDSSKLLREDGTYPSLTVDETKKISDKFGEIFAVGMDAINQEVLYKYKELFELAEKIDGRIKTLSIHAGGVSLSRGTTYDHSATLVAKNGEVVVQADKKMIEKVGLVKVDLLGLKTLRIIQRTLDLIGKDESYIDPNKESFINDEEVYKSIHGGDLDFIFQLADKQARNIIIDTLPKTIEELSDITALIRPDALKFIGHYTQRKLGLEEITYIHNDMKKVTGETYGILIYQEQLLNMIRTFGGYTYAEADVIRRIVGKKILEDVQAEAIKFRERVLENGYSEQIAKELFEYMEEIGGYSFNLSHSIVYSIVSYQTMYLKHYHKLEYITAMLQEEKDNKDKLIQILAYCSKNGIKILPPKLNYSKMDYNTDGKSIYIGLGSIRGVSDKIASAVIERYPIEDILSTLKEIKVDKTSAIGLVKSGFLGEDKIEALDRYFRSSYEPIKLTIPKNLPTKAKFTELFGECLGKTKEEMQEMFIEYKTRIHKEKEEVRYKVRYETFTSKVDITEVDNWEFEALGLFLTMNPYEGISLDKISDIRDNEDGVIGAVLVKVEKKVGRKNKRFAWLTIVSQNGLVYKILAYDTVLTEYYEILKKGAFTILQVTKNKSGELIMVKKAKLLKEFLK